MFSKPKIIWPTELQALGCWRRLSSKAPGSGSPLTPAAGVSFKHPVVFSLGFTGGKKKPNNKPTLMSPEPLQRKDFTWKI